MEQVNTTLLKALCEIVHPSRQEQAMITYILNFCYTIEGIKFEMDDENNLFITKNTTNPTVYPCLVAHLDEILHYTGVKCARIKGNKIYGYYKKTGKQCGLGLDDCFGIYICLHCLYCLPDLKVCFTTQEEMGCIGAEVAGLNIDFFDNCRFLLQADRMGGQDLITHTNGIDITSDEFLEDIDSLLEKYKYKEARVTMTDVGTLKENINLSAVNISCGYYCAHTHKEYGNLTELNNCLNFILDIIKLNDKVYEHTADLSGSYSRYSNFSWPPGETEHVYAYQDSDEAFYENLADKCSNCKTYRCDECNYY